MTTACPACGSPMSVKLWLKLADCYVCDTSIQLADEDLEEIKRLLPDVNEPEQESEEPEEPSDPCVGCEPLPPEVGEVPEPTIPDTPWGRRAHRLLEQNYALTEHVRLLGREHLIASKAILDGLTASAKEQIAMSRALATQAYQNAEETAKLAEQRLPTEHQVKLGSKPKTYFVTSSTSLCLGTRVQNHLQSILRMATILTNRKMSKFRAERERREIIWQIIITIFTISAVAFVFWIGYLILTSNNAILVYDRSARPIRTWRQTSDYDHLGDRIIYDYGSNDEEGVFRHIFGGSKPSGTEVGSKIY